ncbi:helix-turn-helix domain-containing protein [Afipia clevelandensis]|uniref:helix-turn-helix domain-containing protein n=1 Tax=Afipia clevelandensis TaxID=1034 RepID=UPI00058BFAEA|nr:helix-turn-helix transcriptional regulator [Afipia clevelandensis]
MQKTLKSKDYERLIGLLVAARERAGIRQHTLAETLDVPQSFVAKYEGGDRRLDVIEFIAIARALGADPIKLLRDFLAGKSPTPPRKRG